MFKKLFVVMLFTSAALFAADETVAFSDKVGAKANLTQEALYLLRAALSNPGEIAKLTQGRYHIGSVSVEVLAPKSEHFTAITRYTFTAYERVGLPSPMPTHPKTRKLSLQAYIKRDFRDGAPYVWETSGVQEN